MKKILSIATVFMASLGLPAMAQDKTNVPALSPLLTQYYDIKDALIGGNAGAAAAKAGEFVKTVSGVDMKSLPAAVHHVFMPLEEKLIADAKFIAGSTDISQQREHFKTFSDNFYLLAKGVSLTRQPVYQEYCPMKKAYWLSSSSAIKNPYYGSQMLTCGKVSDTIK
ncbi:uncharacterized protein DUF3347 [Chitinophaga niastensis]|uniref:Uncharacterized protein DUF3347 n=1 Tax=Chitinophaga niastensis TaxID=536980 RepID=A0A2P8HGM6_CHINA|nr:DUF3347 domain-containing protein [Chitinophaga niastensis]PSL45350.1 uncharacterized protein DUF3347 [Chitinophaga niastensis]